MIVGKVKQVFSNPWQGRNGVVQLHSFQLEGDKTFYRTGTTALVAQNDHVKFETTGNNNVVPESLRFVEPADEPRTAPKIPATPKEDFGARQQYWENKERHDIEVTQPRITYAGASRDAITVVGMALQHGLLSFGNAGKGAKLPMLLDYIAEVTATLYTQRMDPSTYPTKAPASAAAPAGELSDD